MTETFTDSTILRTTVYQNDDDLRVRRETHERYSERRDDFHDWVIGLLPRKPSDAILDIGTGPGDFPRRLRAAGHVGQLWGVDLSEGMVQTAKRAAPHLRWLVADVQALPFADRAWDAVLARHMLYHVPDIHQAVREMARTIHADGWVMATTNSFDSQRGILQLWQEVERPLVVNIENPVDRFPLEAAADFFAPYFERVETHLREDALLFSSPEPMRRYLLSGRGFRMKPEHTENDWENVTAQLSGAVDRFWARESRNGVLRVPKQSGLVLAFGPKTGLVS